jgi:hypothetical protein
VEVSTIAEEDIYDSDATSTYTTGWWLNDSSGTPTLTASPVGAATFTVRYVKDSPELDDDGDTPLIPARYHGIWIDLAVAYAYEDSDNFSAAQGIRNAALQRLQALVERYETRNRMGGMAMAETSFNEDD